MILRSKINRMKNIKRNKNQALRLLLLAAAAFLFINSSLAQPGLPQREITVLPTQTIDFGTFFVTGAGSITVDYAGNVTTSGGVISIDQSSVAPAIFEIKLCQGRMVILDYDYSVMMNGANGGQLELVIGPTEHGANGAEFPVNGDCDFITVLRVGGTLEVSANPFTGVYTGMFPITFTQR